MSKTMYLVTIILALTGCSSHETSSQTAIKHQDIEQLADASVMSTPDDTDAGTTDDQRIEVAYCAATVLDATPGSCRSSQEDQTLVTQCDTGLAVHWNCERCADVLKNGLELGHVLMTSPIRFEVSAPQKNLYYVCDMDPTGAGFTYEQLQ